MACQARKAGIHFVKEGNCFTHVSDTTGLAQLADTLLQPGATGQLSQVCDRWICTACPCFALDLEEQKHSRFHYDYSIYQLEYSRNLIFEVGHHMDQVFQALIDRSRVPLDLKTIKTIQGTRHRPHCRARKKRSAEWEVAVERPVYDLTIFKLHCGKLTLKCYTKGERVLRIEAMAHHTQQLDCGRSLPKFPDIVSKLNAILERFQQALSCMDQCFIADQTLEQLPAPTRVGQSRVGGIDFNKPRIRWVAEAVLALAPNPGGFSAAELGCQVLNLGGPAASDYGRHQASYDLKKFRGKQMVRRLARKQRYEPLPQGLKALAALLFLRDKVIQPLLAGALQTRPARGAQNPTRLDHHYEALRVGMRGLFHELGIAA